VVLAADTDGNLCSFVGAWFDIVFEGWTVFDGLKGLYLRLKRHRHEASEAEVT